MNLYMVQDASYEWCCYCFDITRNKAKMRAASHFGLDFVDMRCKTLKKGVNVPEPTLVTHEEDEGYNMVRLCGYYFLGDTDAKQERNELVNRLCSFAHNLGQMETIGRIVDEVIRSGYRKVVFCKDCVYNKNGGCMHSEEYDEPNYNPEYFCADGLRSEDNE